MADTPESKIFRKLADALTFHPAGAKLFMPDWTLEPGDIVTVSSDDEDYDVPIYSMDFKWNGQGMADVQSTGNQKREPLSALRRKEYQSGRRGAGRIREIEEEFKEFETWKVETDETLESHAGQFVEILGEDGEPGRLTIAETNIGQTASDAYIIATAAGIKLDENGHPELDDQGHYQYDPDAGDTTLTARINTNATNIDLKVSQQDLDSTLSSYLLINSFGTELGTTLDNGDTTLAAKIITAIDKQEGESMVTIDADQINLEGVVTAVFLDSRMANIDNLFSDTGFFGGINAHSITTNGGGQTGDGIGTITGDILYATSQLSIGHGAGSSSAAAGSFYYQGAEYTPKTVKKAGEVQNNIKLFGTGTDTEIDIGGSGILDASVANNVLTLTKSDGTTTVNFSKATALNTGSVEADGETKQAGWSSGMFTVIATQTNKNTATNQYETNEVGRTTTSLTIPLGHWGDPTQSEDPNTYYQGISAVIGSSLSAVDTGKSIQVNATPRYNAGKNSVGLAPMSYTAFQDENYPSSQTIYTDTTGRTDASGTEDNLHRDITLSLDVDDSYVYMKHGSDIIARISNPGSGASYAAGYAKGQENANAVMSGVALNLASTSYSADDKNLTIQILARPKLELFSEDDPPIKTEVLGENEAFDKTMDIAVTNVTISDSSIVYNHNGTYTIGGTGGKVNIGAAGGHGGANIPVDTNAHPFTPTEALNDVNVVKGNWTGTTTKTIEFTTDAPNPVSGSSKSVSLTLNKGGWTWEAEDGGGGNYKAQVQVKDGSAGILTDYVTMPDLSVDVDKPQQQDSWWNTSGTYAYQYVVPQIGAVPYLSSDTSKQNPLGYYHNDGTIVINPSQAIEHGKSLVSVTRTWTEYDGTPSGDTPLDPGKTYHLEVKKDSTTVYDELYTVPEQAAPTVNTWGLTHQTGTDYTYKASVNVNGTQYESGNLNATEAYNNGWTGAYQSVGIFPTAVADLVPGGSPITIYAQAKENSGSAKLNVASVQVKARALNLKDETFTANDTYAVPEGYDGYGSVTVNVQADQDAYNNGWDAASGVVSIPTSVSADDTVSVSTPYSRTVSGGTTRGTDTNTYTLKELDNNSVILNWDQGNNGSGITVGRLNHNEYNNGWLAAAEICSPPTAYTGDAESADFTVGIPSSTVGSGTTYSFTIGQETPSATNKWAYVNYDDSGTSRLVGKINVSGWYTAGQGSVSAILSSTTVPSGTTPSPLSSGDYGVYMVKDNVADSNPIAYYRVSSGGGVTYVAGTSGNLIPVYKNTPNSMQIEGRLYPNTIVTLGSSTDSLGRRQITYNGRTGYVSASYISNTRGPTNYPTRIGWADEGDAMASRSVTELSTVILSASDAGTVTQHTVNVSYDDGNTETGGATVVVDASAIAGGGGSTTRTAESLRDTIVLPASHTGTAVIYGNYVEYDDESESGNFPVVINASAVYQQGRTDGSGQVVNGTITSVEKYLVDGYEQSYDENTHKYTVHVKATGTNISNSPYTQDIVVLATRAYNQGKTKGGASNVTITSITGTDLGNPSGEENPGTIVATASNGKTGSEYLYLTQGNWNSSNKRAVNIRVGSTSGPLIARTWVDAPSTSHSITCSPSRSYSSSQPNDFNRTVSKEYKYHTVTVTCGDVSKVIQFTLN